MTKEITEERLNETASQIQAKLNADKEVRNKCVEVAKELSEFNGTEIDPEKIEIRVKLDGKYKLSDSVASLKVEAYLRDAVGDGNYLRRQHGAPILDKALERFPKQMVFEDSPPSYYHYFDRQPVMEASHDIMSERQLSALESHFRDKVLGIF